MSLEGLFEYRCIVNAIIYTCLFEGLSATRRESFWVCSGMHISANITYIENKKTVVQRADHNQKSTRWTLFVLRLIFYIHVCKSIGVESK